MTITLAAAPLVSSAACNPDTDLWKGPAEANRFLPPASGTRVFINFKQEGLAGFGESPSGSATSPYPPKLAESMVDAQPKALSFDGPSAKLSYYEHVANYGWRICREDTWISGPDDGDKAPLQTQSERYAVGNALLAGLVENGRLLAFSTTYSYDRKGRIERIEQADFAMRPAPVFKALHCRRYDDKDRILLWVRPKSTGKCPKGEPALADEWHQFKYGIHNGESVQLLSRWHIPKPNGAWKEQWAPVRVSAKPDSIKGNANVDSRRGVWEIYGSTFGHRDNNAANMVVDVFGQWNGATYYFTKPSVPLSVLENPDEIYKYERRRMTRLDNDTRMFELFKPNEHFSRHRIYMLAGFVLRHEQLDEKGRIRRIITVNDWKQPRPGPKPDFDDKLLKTSLPRLMAHQVYHRIYDVKADGRPTLIAASWNRSVRNPLKDVPLSEADLVFGTPDGKEKWKNREDFDKAFDTSENARQVFTEVAIEEDED